MQRENVDGVKSYISPKVMNPTIAPNEVTQVLVLGAGTIGTGWAAYFMSKGLHVHLVDPERPDTASHADIQRMLAVLHTLTPEAVWSPGEVHLHDHPGPALSPVQFVQECILEDLAAKQRVLSEVEGIVSADTVICTSTSSLLPTAIQAGCRHPARVLAGHPFNPPHLLPLVEVVAGQATAPAVVDWTLRFYQAVGKFPVRVKKEVVGHIANRLTSALFREAVHILAEGVATAKDIDDVITQGPGLRWALLGPFLIYHLGGGEGGIRSYLDHLGDSHPARWATLGNPVLNQAVQDTIVQSVLAEYGNRPIGDQTSERDRNLVRLLQMKSA